MYKRFITVNGNAYERGFEIGRQLKMQIETNYLNQAKYYDVPNGVNYTEWGEMAMRYVPFLEKWTPEVLEEMKGTAEGAGMEFKQILAMTTAYEKSFCRDMVEDKCTAFLLSKDVTKEQKVIVGQTNDECYTEWLYQLDTVIHHVDGGQEVMTYTHPGIPAYMGINNDGLAVLWTYIDNGVTGNGVPTNAIIRHLLTLKSVDEAVDFLKKVPHDIPNQFGVADKAGNIASVECFPNKVYVDCNKLFLVHTNHTAFADEPEYTCSKTTWDRYDVMKEQIEGNIGDIDVQKCEDFLRSHERFPNSICSHAYPEKPWNKTLAAMVFDLTEGEMHITFGNPCESEYHTYKFDNYK